MPDVGSRKRIGFRIILRAFLFSLGSGLLFWGLYAPIGAQIAYAYRRVDLVAADSTGDCPRLDRGERVRLWPITRRGEQERVRLVDDEDCSAARREFSLRPRPRLRRLTPGRLIFAHGYPRVNIRREPDLDDRFLVRPRQLASPDEILEAIGLVTGSDDMDWLEAIIVPGELVYIKFNRLEHIPAGDTSP